MTEPEREYAGTYLVHWEAPRLRVVTGRRWFGLLPRVERWDVQFPEHFELPEWKDAERLRRAGALYAMRLYGRLGPRGNFGHKGICCRQLHVSRVVSCERTDGPATGL